MASRARRRATVVMGAVASAVLFLGTSPAAAETIRCYTSPSNRGHATLDTTWGILYVEDTYSDGRRVVATAYNSSGDAVAGYAEDSNGSNNGPGAGTDVDVAMVGWITTCTQNGTSIRTRANCSTTYL
ncbi:hypothetical protein [Streptomyces echinatus]|uniref:hypothetical protein n=1 Tax=Streptomyces echinatus TaxID=67293 RepID=UPI003788E239